MLYDMLYFCGSVTEQICNTTIIPEICNTMVTAVLMLPTKKLLLRCACFCFETIRQVYIHLDNPMILYGNTMILYDNTSLVADNPRIQYDNTTQSIGDWRVISSTEQTKKLQENNTKICVFWIRHSQLWSRVLFPNYNIK